MPAYTKLIGIDLIIMGMGISITGLFSMFESPVWWVQFSGGIAAGIFVMNKAQIKYNGSWFGLENGR